MRRMFTAAAVAVLAAGMVGAAQAATGGVSAAGAQITVQFASPARFDGPGCARTDWQVTYSKPDDVELTVEYGVRQQGSNTRTWDYFYVYDSAPATGTKTGTMCFDSYDYTWGNGPLIVSGVLKVDNDSYQRIGEAPWQATGGVTLQRNRSTVVSLRVRPATATRFARVAGRITAATLTKGRIGADGELAFAVKRGGRWRELPVYVGGYLDNFGRFTAQTTANLQAGSKVRVRLTDCFWCTNTGRTVTVR